MVFFTCNSCGTCIKKPAVEKHIFQCRNFGSLSCMDCNKDFVGNEYKVHTKCVSELEKYSGEGWKAPTGHNKGEKKQGAWMDTVTATLEKAERNASPQVKSLLQLLTRHDNVPRKKPKFMNFLKNIAKNRFDSGTITSVWDLLEEQRKLEQVVHNGNKGKTIPVEIEEEKVTAPPASPIANDEPPTDETHERKKAKKSKKHKRSKEKEEELEAVPDSTTEGIATPTPEEEEPAEEEEYVPKRKKHKKKKHHEDS